MVYRKRHFKRRGKKRISRRRRYPMRLGSKFQKLPDHFPPSVRLTLTMDVSFDQSGTAGGGNFGMVVNVFKG